MLDEKRKVIKQHVAGATAENDAYGDPKDEIVDLRQRHRRRAAPQRLVLDQRARIEPSQHDPADIGQRIPTDRNRPDGDGDGIEYRESDRENGHQRASGPDHARATFELLDTVLAIG